MKSMKKFAVLSIIVLSLVAFRAHAAEEDKPTASADVGVLSKYVWRGYELSHDSAVIQPSMSVGYKGFGMNLWANLDTAFDDMDPTTKNESDLTETDLTLSYDGSLGPVTLGAGVIYYSLTGVDTQEIYVRFGLDIPLSPSITAYRDIAEFNGWYFNLGVSYSFALPKNISFGLSGSIGYYYSTDDAFVTINDQLVATTDRYNALHDGLLSANLTIPFGKFVTVTPSISYSFPLSDDADNLLKAASFSGHSDFVYGGITLSFAI